jgi:hypothetical protein
VQSVFVHFRASVVFTVIALVAGYMVAGIQGAVTVAFLTVLETSLSFDNAVVNAAVLNGWNEVWRRRFLVWGMAIAVFGMRLVFPLLIVGVVGEMSPLRALDLALNSPHEYGQVLASAHHRISAFGGAFLMMVFLKFFVDRHKTEH